MKRYIIISIILLVAFSTHASENTQKENSAQSYRECVAVSLFTVEGREINSMVTNNRAINKTNLIPDGWTVVGVTTQSDSDMSNPYIVICQ